MISYDPQVYMKTRRTKIVATIGIASDSEEKLKKMILAGMNVARLNFSHGTHESHRLVIQRIRKIAKTLNTRVAILGDLCGPKIRVGKFVNGCIVLKPGEYVTIVTNSNEIGRDNVIPSQYPQLIRDIQIGQVMLLDDGKIELKVTSIDSSTKATCQVLRGGELKDHKGMNFPGTPLSVPALTEKDLEDLQFCLAEDVDYIALSFVRKAREIRELKEKITDLTRNTNPNTRLPVARVVAKIEKPQALEEIEQIIDESDAIMVARGDLGVEIPLQKVPVIQEKLIQKSRQRNKPVIVATQMLESMMVESRPTRAEISDVAGAVFAQADAVMLSGETAAGNHPVESVKVMDTILREIENHQWTEGMFGQLQSDVSIFPAPNALARACTLLSQDLEIRAINVRTRTGITARVVSAMRPNAPILAYCQNAKIVNQMILHWGVTPILIDEDLSGENFCHKANDTVKELNLATLDQFILMVSVFSGKPQQHISSIVLYQVS